MPRLACVSIDLDELHHYSKLHGLGRESLPEPARNAVYRAGLERFLGACAQAGVKATLFAIGSDLAGDSAGLLRKAVEAGHEVGNHTWSHDYELSRQSPAEISADLLRGADAIERATGVRPRGFRAPGYTFNAAMYRTLVKQGYAYGSSVYPAAPYYLAKAAVMGLWQLVGRNTVAMLDSPEVLAAPLQPYLPDPDAPYRRGKGPVVELPIAVEPVSRMPFIGTFTLALPGPAMMTLYRAVRRHDFLNYELHGADFLDASDAGPVLAAAQKDLQVSAKRKLARFQELVHALQQDYEVVTLLEASGQVLAAG